MLQLVRPAVVVAVAATSLPALGAQTNLNCTYFEAVVDPDSSRVTHSHPQYGTTTVDASFTATEVSYRVSLLWKGGMRYRATVKINRTNLQYVVAATVGLEQLPEITNAASDPPTGTCYVLPPPPDRKF